MSERNGDVIGTVLTGAGRGFCSGVDMKALGNMTEAGKRVGESYDNLAADPGNPDNDPNYQSSPTYFLGLRKPLIAAVNGACAGLGFSYATFCDMRFVDPKAKFVTSFGPRGLIAEQEAYRIGYANRLCAEDQCVSEAQEYLRSIAKTSAPMSIMMMKRQVYKHLNRELGDAMEESTRWMDESLARDDFKEGVQSFVEKRAPNFQRIEVD